MYSLQLYREITSACPANYSEPPSEGCSALYSQMQDALGEFNVYNIYDQCPSSDGGSGGNQRAGGGVQAQTAGADRGAAGSYTLAELLEARHGEGSETFESTGRDDSLHPHPGINKRLGGALNDWVCGGSAMDVYLASVEVQKAIHVAEHPSNSMRYTSTVADLRPVYKRLAEKYRMLIYSGDVDACVPYVSLAHSTHIHRGKLASKQTMR
eukprot:SAG22_NODE_4988_length_1114_cov_1.130049_1_plen_211_part_00